MTKAIESVETSSTEATSSVITADELMLLVEETTEQYPIKPGKHAVIRSLTYAEVKRIVAQNKGNKDELELSAFAIGCVEPTPTPTILDAMRRGKAGPLMNAAKRIMVISGMVDDDANLGEGGASS